MNKMKNSVQRDIYVKCEHSEDGCSYYLLPKWQKAIPKADNSKDTLLKFLVEHGDFEHSQDLSDYPIVSKRHLQMHFNEYEILPVLKNITVTKPIVTLSPMELEARERRRKIKAVNAANELAFNKKEIALLSNPFTRQCDLDEFYNNHPIKQSKAF